MNGGPVHVEVLIRGARPTQAFEVGNPWCSAVAALFAMLSCPSMALILIPAISCHHIL